METVINNPMFTRRDVPADQRQLIQALGTHMETNRMVQLNTISNQLANNSNATAFSDWPIETRNQALEQLESAFLDPKGILTSIAGKPAFAELQTPDGLEQYKKRLEPRLS